TSRRSAGRSASAPPLPVAPRGPPGLGRRHDRTYDPRVGVEPTGDVALEVAGKLVYVGGRRKGVIVGLGRPQAADAVPLGTVEVRAEAVDSKLSHAAWRIQMTEYGNQSRGLLVVD